MEENVQIPIGKQSEVEIPKWAKLTFRVYAVFLFIVVSYASVLLFQSGQKITGILSAIGINSILLSVAAIIVSLLVLLILELLYSIGLYRLKRWTLPILLIFSSSTILVELLKLMHLNLDGPKGVAELVASLIMLPFLGLFIYISIKYWTSFEGPTKKILIQLPLLLFMVVYIIFGILNQVYIDDPEINDSDLVLENVDILDQAKNAHYYLPVIDELSLEQIERFEEARAFFLEVDYKADLNSTEALAHMTNTEELTNGFIVASSKQAYQCPTLANNYTPDALFCSLNDIMNLAQVTSLRASVEVGTGNSEQAIETGLSILRMGSLMSRSEQPTLIEHLVGIALTKIGLESIERTVVYEGSLPEEKLAYLSSELDKYFMDGSSFVNSLRAEYIYSKNTLALFESLSNNYFFHYNKTVNNQAEFIRSQHAIATSACGADYAEKSKELDTYVENEKNKIGILLYLSPNSMGKLLNTSIIASLGSVREKECENNNLIQSIQISIEDIRSSIEPLSKHRNPTQFPLYTYPI